MKTQRFLTYVTAAALAAGTFGLAGCKDDPAANNTSTADNRTPGQAVDNALDKAGDKAGELTNATTREAGNLADKASAVLSPSGADTVAGIRGTIEGVVQNVAQGDDWEGMADFFTEADEKRIMSAKGDTADLNAMADKFTAAYREKYNDAFTVMNASEKFNADFMTLPAAAQDGKGTATIKASHGLPELTLPFVVQDGKWKLDIPDSLDTAKLYASLKQAFADLDVSKLPATEVEAARHVSHRILMAVMDKNQ